MRRASARGRKLNGLITRGVTGAPPKIWDAETQALFAAVMSFWFSQRALNKIRKGM